MKRLYVIAAVAALAVVANPVLAGIQGIHYFVTDSTLYRAEKGILNSSVAISSGGRYAGLAFDPSGNLWGSNIDNNTFYMIDPATGNATVMFSYADVSGDILSFDFRIVDNTLQLFGMAGDTAYMFDASNGALIGSNDNFPGGQEHRFPSTAFFPSSSTYFGTSPSDFSLYTLQADSGPASLIGAITDSETGNNLSWTGGGGAFFGGQYWSVYRMGDDVAFGTIDTDTAVFAEQFRFTGFGGATSLGYAVIPTPGAAFALLGMAGLMGTRRRRR